MGRLSCLFQGERLQNASIRFNAAPASSGGNHRMKAICGEIWTKVGGEWKVLRAQETKVK